MICAFQAQNMEFKLPQSCPENGNLFLEVAAVLDNSEEEKRPAPVAASVFSTVLLNPEATGYDKKTKKIPGLRIIIFLAIQ